MADEVECPAVEMTGNGGFDDQSVWVLTPKWTIAGGQAHCVSLINELDVNMSQVPDLVVGRWYRLAFRVPRIVVGGMSALMARIGFLPHAFHTPQITVPGDYYFAFKCNQVGWMLFFKWAPNVGTLDCDVDDVTLIDLAKLEGCTFKFGSSPGTLYHAWPLAGNRTMMILTNRTTPSNVLTMHDSDEE